MTHDRLPLKLPLLPGLKWTGHLRVEERVPVSSYLVSFDAKARGGEFPYVYDRAYLTAKQLRDWTGWSE